MGTISLEKARKEREQKKEAEKKWTGGNGNPPNGTPPGPPGSDNPGPCPVHPLGLEDGVLYFLSPSGQVRDIPGGRLSKLEILQLFENEQYWLWEKFPRRDDDGHLKGWDLNKAQAWLIHECACAGLFNPTHQLRGPGVWIDPGDLHAGVDEHLVVHCGDRVLLTHTAVPLSVSPGRHGNNVYPASAAEPRPHEKELPTAQGRDLLNFFSRWKWKRGPLDAILLLGWVCSGVMVGTLKWRPSIWVSGQRASGKTTLMTAVAKLLGSALLQLSDTTEAAVRQTLRNSARPVAIDEIEAEEVNNRSLQVVRLARISSTAESGMIGRGQTSGKAHIQTMNAVFMFSSILRPPLNSADLQRVSLLDLEPSTHTKEESREVARHIRRLDKIGRQLRRRLINRWPQCQRSIEAFEDALVDDGFSGRAADQLAPLFGLASVLLYDDVPASPDIEAWTSLISPADLKDQTDDAEDWQQCLGYLMSSPVNSWPGGRQTPIGVVVEAASKENGEESRELLKNIGLRVMASRGEWNELHVSNGHRMLAEIFKGSVWGTSSGKSGGWVQALKRVPGAKSSGKTVRIGGWTGYTVVIPVAMCISSDTSSSLKGEDDPVTDPPDGYQSEQPGSDPFCLPDGERPEDF